MGVLTAFAAEELARSHWSQIERNDEYAIYAVQINAFSEKPCLPVAWVVLKKGSV